MYSLEELEMIKTALETDIKFQKSELEDMGHDIRFEIWLMETEKLHKKVSLEIAELKRIEELKAKTN